MTNTPMSDDDLTAIRQRNVGVTDEWLATWRNRTWSNKDRRHYFQADVQATIDRHDLLTEVDRLKAQNDCRRADGERQ